MQTPVDFELPASTFNTALDSMRPGPGDYGLALRLLRFRANRTGFFPWKLYGLLQPVLRRGSGTFIGETSRGIRYVGDRADRYAVVCAACPDADEGLIRTLCARMQSLPGKSYVDVGTNMGIVATSVARSMGSDGLVVAFEPTPTTAQRAAATFALNGLRNVRLFQAAVGDVEQTIKFYLSPGSSEAASANRTDQRIAVQWEETEVLCVTLDRLFKEGLLGTPGLVKIDVEGHELHVLRGAAKLLSACRPELILEYNRDIAAAVGWDCDDIRAALSPCGEYSLHLLNDDGAMEPMPLGMNPDGLVNIFCRPE